MSSSSRGETDCSLRMERGHSTRHRRPDQNGRKDDCPDIHGKYKPVRPDQGTRQMRCGNKTKRDETRQEKRQRGCGAEERKIIERKRSVHRVHERGTRRSTARAAAAREQARIWKRDMASSCVALRGSSLFQLHYGSSAAPGFLPSLKRARVVARVCPVRCASDRAGGGGSGEGGGGGSSGGNPPRKKGGGDKGRRRFDAGFSFAEGGSGDFCVVPREQQPVNEYQDLTQSLLFPWATDDIWKYVLRLAAIGGFSTLVIGWPVSAVSINASQEPIKCAVGALSGGLGASTLAVVRLYLGWAYVGNRLFSATVEYEETGWYDGEVWVKPPEVLARDRLLAYYKVKPALRRLKVTLVCLAVSLATCAVLLFTLHPPEKKQPVAQDDSPGPSVVRGLYSDKAARNFEPGAFTDEDEVARGFMETCGIPAPGVISKI